ncbi:MAG TPA: 50S ribosomal protein L18 [Candidatus Saccharimonadales bacterium]|jgi:large subunit ribosomal protein L18|nr:50S ribosomal protein L18 [Candidatus Saccharimonadales bacterium]
MRSKEIKAKRYNQRKRRVRAKIIGNAARPRLSVFRSNTHIYGQIINDEDGKTLISYSDLKIKKEAKMTKTMIASQVGEEIAKKAIAKKIKTVVFDRNGFMYHGRVKAIAEGARKGGLVF